MRATVGCADWTPVPDKEIVKGEFCALLATDRLPDAAPTAPGLNVTVMVVDWFGVKVSFEPPVSLNPAPEADALEMLTFEFPVLVSATF